MGGEILFLRCQSTTKTGSTTLPTNTYLDEPGFSHWSDCVNPTARNTKETSLDSGTVRLPTPVPIEKSVEESSTDSDTVMLPTPSRIEQPKEIEVITQSSNEEAGDSDNKEWLPDRPLSTALEAESSSDDSERTWDVKRRRRYALRNFIL